MLAQLLLNRRMNDFVAVLGLLTYLLSLISPHHLTDDRAAPLETSPGFQDSEFLLLMLLWESSPPVPEM